MGGGSKEFIPEIFHEKETSTGRDCDKVKCVEGITALMKLKLFDSFETEILYLLGLGHNYYVQNAMRSEQFTMVR